MSVYFPKRAELGFVNRFLQRISVFAKKPSFFFLVFYLCFGFWFNDLLKPYRPYKNETNFVWDAAGYYSYLPAVFYYGNFELEGMYPYFLPLNKANERYPKYTYGVALMEAPFYGLGYLSAKLSGQSLNGFSTPFADSVRWGCMLYGLIGLWFLRKFLLHFFNELITAITLFCCFFGTMLYMYTYVQGEIAHGYLFVLFSLFLYCTLRWHQKPSHFYSICLALLLGVISIIRVTEIYIVAFFVFWNVKSLSDIAAKFRLFLKNYKLFLWFPLFVLLLWLPQLFMWKRFLGSYFANPYIGEHFFWNDPQILNILFSYRKGWITYTPLALLAFAGLFFIPQRFPVSKWTFLFVMVFTIYVFSCWWDWNYGGCFGNRAFCQQIAFLALPIASFLEYVFFKISFQKWRTFASLVLLVFIFSCCFFNFSLSYQYQEQRKLHPNDTGKKIYWGLFRQFHYGPKFVNDYGVNLIERDADAWMRGEQRDDINNQKIYEFGE